MTNHNQKEVEIKVTCPDCHNNLDLGPRGVTVIKYLGGSAIYSFICTYPKYYCGEVSRPADAAVELLLTRAGVRVIEITRPDELDDVARSDHRKITENDIADYKIDEARLATSDIFKELGHNSIS